MLIDLIKCILKINSTSLEVGDIIIAKRYNNILGRLKIKKGHRIGPYIVTDKRINKICVLACTSSKKNLNYYFKLNSKYNLDKETYVNLKEVKKIKYKNYIKTIDKLSKKDLKLIIKKCKELNNK